MPKGADGIDQDIVQEIMHSWTRSGSNYDVNVGCVEFNYTSSEFQKIKGGHISLIQVEVGSAFKAGDKLCTYVVSKSGLFSNDDYLDVKAAAPGILVKWLGNESREIQHSRYEIWNHSGTTRLGLYQYIPWGRYSEVLSRKRAEKGKIADAKRAEEDRLAKQAQAKKAEEERIRHEAEAKVAEELRKKGEAEKAAAQERARTAEELRKKEELEGKTVLERRLLKEAETKAAEEAQKKIEAEAQAAEAARKLEEKRIEAAEIERQNRLEEYPIIYHVETLTTRLNEIEEKDIKGEKGNKYLALYAGLKALLRKTSKVPLEKRDEVTASEMRLNQIETLNDLYAEKILRIKQDEDLDEELKEIKIENIRRLWDRDISKLEGM